MQITNYKAHTQYKVKSNTQYKVQSTYTVQSTKHNVQSRRIVKTYKDILSIQALQLLLKYHTSSPFIDEIDLLLLGAAESGKSTILKQMRIIHKADYGLEERIMFKPIVYANAIHSMSLILHAVERLGIDLDSEESEYDAYVFYQLLEEQTSHMHTLVEDIKVTKELSKVIFA